MNWKFFPRLTSLLALTLGAPLIPSLPSSASTFTETAIEQTEVIAVARPYGVETTKYDLLVIEQIPGKNKCWETSGATPSMVEPLLLNFDFTGHCRRATDSNGYSVRIDGQDYGLDYLLRLVPRGNELVLVATARNGRGQELVIGSTKGIGSGFMQVELYPGWQFTKRTYDGKVLGHYYISGSQASIMGGSAATAAPAPVTPDLPELEETIIPALDQPQPVDTGGTVTETETEIIIQQNDQSSTVIEEEDIITVTETEVVKETVTKPAPVVTPPRRRSPTPADFRR